VVAFRATAFNDATVVEMLRSQFVCVGIAHNGAGRRKDAEGDFARKLIGKGGTLQGLHVINTRGDLIGYVYDFHPESVLAMLRQSLKKFEPVDAPAIDFKEKDRRFVMPANGLVVASTARVLAGHDPVKAQKGTLQYDMEIAWKSSLGREHLWVREDEAKALAEGKLPRSLELRLVRYHLVDNTRGTPTGWTEKEIKKVDLKLQDGRLTGSVHLETKDGSRGYEAEVLGFLEAKDGKVTRFDMVVSGQFWGQGVHTPGAPKGRFPLAIAFRLLAPSDPLHHLVPDAVRCYPDYLR
jgi:hypothetical protein